MKGEELEQYHLIQWCDLQKNKYPILSLLTHVPNGGSRNKIEAAKLKKIGVRAGFPDLFLPYSNKKYHGLFIELKYGKNKASENQKKWIKELNNQGYYAVVCVGFEEAKNTILEYIK